MRRDTRDVTEKGSITADNVRLQAFNSAAIRYYYPEYDALDPATKVHILREAAEDGTLSPTETRSSNAVTRGMDEAIPDSLNPNTPPVVIRALAVGSGEADPTYEDAALLSEGTRIEVASVETAERSVLATTLIGQNRANGITIREISALAGQRLGDLRAVNRALVAPFEKTTMRELVVDVEFRFRAADSPDIEVTEL